MTTLPKVNKEDLEEGCMYVFNYPSYQEWGICVCSGDAVIPMTGCFFTNIEKSEFYGPIELEQ